MDPAKMKVVDLRSELGALGLDTKGNKPALVERLKKALEAKTGKVFADTTVLDTTTEEADEPATPRRPAARASRRRSSYLASTPAKVPREEAPRAIDEDETEESEQSQESQQSQESVKSPEPQRSPEPPKSPERQKSPPRRVPAPVQEEPAVASPPKEPEKDQKETPKKPDNSGAYNIDDTMSPEPEVKQEAEESENKEVMEVDNQAETEDKKPEEEEDSKKDVTNLNEENNEQSDQSEDRRERRKRPLTEEEEWEELNERLRIREQERLEREKKQAEEDAKRFEQMSKNPAKLQQLRRKQEKKARWRNYYRSIEVTNEVLAPPLEDPLKPAEPKIDSGDQKVIEPEINENRITLSWYDSDLNQYLEVPGLAGVVPLSEGAFAHAWK